MLLAAEWQTPPDTKSLLQSMAEVTLATIPPSTEQDEAAFKRMCQTAIDSYRLIDGYNGAGHARTGQADARLRHLLQPATEEAARSVRCGLGSFPKTP